MNIIDRIIHKNVIMDLVDDLVASVHDATIKHNYRMAPEHDRIYAELEEKAKEYAALKYCYSPDEVFSNTCACGEEPIGGINNGDIND